MNIFKKLPQAMVRVIATGALLVATAFGSIALGASSAGATNVTAASFASNSNVSGATATWTVGWTNTTAITAAAGHTVTVTFPSTFTVAAVPTVTLSAAFTGATCVGTGATTANVVVITLEATCAVAPAATPTLTIQGVVNGGARSYAAANFSVATSSDVGAVNPTAAIVITGALIAPTAAMGNGSTDVNVSFIADGTATQYLVTDALTPTSAIAGTVGQTCYVSSATAAAAGTSLTCSLTGLTAGASYYFYVTPTAQGTTGINTISAKSAAFLVQAGVSSIIVLDAGSDNLTPEGTQIYVMWKADGVATSYTVTYGVSTTAIPQAHAGCTVGSGSPLTGMVGCLVDITNAVTATHYYFAVVPTGSTASTGALGDTTSVVTHNVINAYATAGAGGTAIVQFPADGTASTYVVTAVGGAAGLTCTIANGTTAPSGLQSCTVGGLTGGSAYTFAVTASGNGTQSAAGTSNSITAKTAMTTPTVANGPTLTTGATVVVSFTATGISPVYTVAAAPVSTGVYSTTLVCTVANTIAIPTGAQSCTVGGLTAGTAYTFNVTPSGAVPPAVEGATVSASSAQITTLSAFATPTATAGAGKVTVSFNADGAATTYLVTANNAASPYAQVGTCTLVYTTAPLAGTAQSCAVTPLTAGVAVTATVTPSGGTETANKSLASGSATPTGTQMSTSATVAQGAATATKDSAVVTFTADGVATSYYVGAFDTSAHALAATAASIAAYAAGGPAGNTGIVGTPCLVANTSVAPTGSVSCRVTGLTDNTAYFFAIAPQGTGETSSTDVTATAFTTTNKLAKPTAVQSAAKTATVSFTADGVATGYTVYYGTTGAAAGDTTYGCSVVNSTTAPTGAQSCVITGLTNGSGYFFNVVPAAGTTYSAASLDSSLPVVIGVTPLATPSMAWNSASTSSSGVATVNFFADGVASTYTVYVYTVSPVSAQGLATTCSVANSTTAPTGAQSCTVKGLTLGYAYQAQVVATGNGDTAAPSANSGSFFAATYVAPSAAVVGASTGVTANAATIHWTAPTSNGGSAVLGYQIAVINSTSGLSIVCGKAGPTVTAINCAGLSAASVYEIDVIAQTPFGISTGKGSLTTSALVLATPVTATFVKGKATLTAAAKAALTSLVSSLADGAKVSISASGATKALAAARANTIASFIMNAGAAVHLTITSRVSKTATSGTVTQTA